MNGTLRRAVQMELTPTSREGAKNIYVYVHC